MKFTANVICRQILAQQAAQAVKADALKVQQHSAVVATKEAANVAVNAEAVAVVTEEAETRVVEAKTVAVTVGFALLVGALVARFEARKKKE